MDVAAADTLIPSTEAAAVVSKKIQLVEVGVAKMRTQVRAVKALGKIREVRETELRLHHRREEALGATLVQDAVSAVAEEAAANEIMVEDEKDVDASVNKIRSVTVCTLTQPATVLMDVEENAEVVTIPKVGDGTPIVEAAVEALEDAVGVEKRQAQSLMLHM